MSKSSSENVDKIWNDWENSLRSPWAAEYNFTEKDRGRKNCGSESWDLRDSSVSWG